MRTLARLLAIMVLSTGKDLSSPLRAQEVTVRSGFEALQDSIVGISDTSLLRHQLRNVDSRSAALPADELAIHEGLIGLRLGDLGADPDFSDARSSFRRAIRLNPVRAEPWFGLGLAEAGRSRQEMGDGLRLGNRVGLGALERAADDYTRALETNPTFVPAAVELAQVTLALLDTARIRQAGQMLRRVLQAMPVHSPELLLALGRLERSAGALDSAATDFEHYLVLASDRGIGLLELARTRLALGRADGEAPYYEGASLDDPTLVSEYRSDLEVVASAADLREFDQLKGQSRAAFLHRFWTERDHWELRPEGERLREHYRRLLFARTNFPLTISRRYYGRLDAYRSGNNEVDDRGIIYIRHGEPADRLRPFIFGVMPNESWRYRRAEGDLLFHFSAGYDSNGGGDLYDYRLVESVLDLHGAADASLDQLLLSRQSLSPIYSRMLNWGRYGSANEGARERNIGRTSITVGTTTDTYELHYGRRLGVLADLIAVGSTAGANLAHFVFGVAAPGTTWRQAPDGVEYTLRVRLSALDNHNTAVATLDTTLVILERKPLSKHEFVVGQVQVSLPAGHWRYRAAVQQGDTAGVVLPVGDVDVASIRGSGLSLSDIALGTPGRAASWVTEAGDSVLLAPSQLFRRGAEVQIYYEAGGVRPREKYRHEISVFPSGNRNPNQQPLVSLAFEEEAAGPVIHSRRTARLDRLKRGDYIVEVKITAPDGRSQTRRRAIRLIDPP